MGNLPFEILQWTLALACYPYTPLARQKSMCARCRKPTRLAPFSERSRVMNPSSPVAHHWSLSAQSLLECVFGAEGGAVEACGEASIYA
jgi:hypothetical protein